MVARDDKRPGESTYPADQDELLQMFDRAAEELTDEDLSERERLVGAFDRRTESQPRDL